MSIRKDLSFDVFEAAYLYLVGGSSAPLGTRGLYYSNSEQDQTGAYFCDRALPDGIGTVHLRFALTQRSVGVYEVLPLSFKVLPSLFSPVSSSTLQNLLSGDSQKRTEGGSLPFGVDNSCLGTAAVDCGSTVPLSDEDVFGPKLEKERLGSVSQPLIEYENKKEPTGVLTGVDVDTLSASVYGEFDNSILQELEVFKKQAQIFDGDFPCSGRLDGWSIKSYGSSEAGMSYILYRGDVRVMCSKGSGKKAANFRLGIGSLSCHEYDIVKLSKKVYELFGFTVRVEFVSRGDLCRDAAHDLADYQMHILNTKNWYWNRKVKLQYYFDGDVFTGFQFGRGKVVMRGYNKGFKLLDDGNCRKTDFFQNYFGVDVSETTVWRLEYQLRREYLRSVGVNTIADFVARKEEIWAYQVNEWVFLAEEEVVRSSGNSSAKGTPMHPAWQVYLNDAEPIERCAPERISSGTDRVFRQGIGCVLSYIMKTAEVTDFPSLVDRAKEAVEFFLHTQEDLASWMFDDNKYHRRLSNFINVNSEPVPF